MIPYFLISRKAPRKRNKANPASVMPHKIYSISSFPTEREGCLHPGYDRLQKQIVRGFGIYNKRKVLLVMQRVTRVPGWLQNHKLWLTSGYCPQPLFLELQHLIRKTLSFLTDEVFAGDPYVFKKDLSCVWWPHAQFVYLFSNMNAWRKRGIRKVTKNRSTMYKYSILRKRGLQKWRYMPRLQWNLPLGKKPNSILEFKSKMAHIVFLRLFPFYLTSKSETVIVKVPLSIMSPNNNCLLVVIILLHAHLETMQYLFAYVSFLVHYNKKLEFNLAVFAEYLHCCETVEK